MYYAFYAPDKPGKTGKKESPEEPWKGAVELRGLAESKSYKVIDYVNNMDYGVVAGPTPKLNVEFKENLLFVATPLPARATR
jgi:hypothetical protein